MTSAAYQPTASAALHKVVIDREITADNWTVVATRTGIYWTWRDDYHSVPAHQALRAASDANEIILMHRRIKDGWELVARLSGPAWRRFQARRP